MKAKEGDKIVFDVKSVNVKGVAIVKEVMKDSMGEIYAVEVLEHTGDLAIVAHDTELNDCLVHINEYEVTAVRVKGEVAW